MNGFDHSQKEVARPQGIFAEAVEVLLRSDNDDVDEMNSFCP
jgi:hypothetical protein